MIEKNSSFQPTGRTSAAKASQREGSLRAYEVEIAGVPLRLRSTLSEEMVRELVEMVDKQITAAMPLTKTGSIQNAAILASLNLAEAFVNLRKVARSELEALEGCALKIVSELENSRKIAVD